MRSSACRRTPGSSLRAATIADRRVEGNLPSVPPFQPGINKIICQMNLRASTPSRRDLRAREISAQLHHGDAEYTEIHGAAKRQPKTLTAETRRSSPGAVPRADLRGYTRIQIRVLRVHPRPKDGSQG